jgi:hypothetical protein
MGKNNSAANQYAELNAEDASAPINLCLFKMKSLLGTNMQPSWEIRMLLFILGK